VKTVAVLGLGSIGSRHAANLRAMGHKVIGWDPVTLPSVILKEAMASSDAVAIASPTCHHFDQIMIARDLGKPVFVEKPIAHGYHSFLSYVEMVGYNLRFHSCVKKAKEWLEAGLIGDPIWASFTCAQYNAKPSYLRDGVILNWSHEIDLALYLLGGAGVLTSATHLTDGADDMTDIILSHASGCQTTVHLDYLSPHENREFIISGPKGQIVANLVRRTAMIETINGTPSFYHGYDSFDENYIEEIQAFLDRIDGKETIGCSGSEALQTLEICLEVRKRAGLS